MKYKVIFDNGKPYEKTFNTDEDLKKALMLFYIENKDINYFDVKVFNEEDEDISESQFIEEIIGDIITE